MKFTNEFNLNNFPFDRQKLNIQIINKTGIHASTYDIQIILQEMLWNFLKKLIFLVGS